MSEPFNPITSEELPHYIGRLVHVRWAHPGCKWELILLLADGNAIIQTPRSNRRLKVKQSDLLKLRHDSYGQRRANQKRVR